MTVNVIVVSVVAVQMRRKPLFYVFNMILPCLLMRPTHQGAAPDQPGAESDVND